MTEREWFRRREASQRRPSPSRTKRPRVTLTPGWSPTRRQSPALSAASLSPPRRQQEETAEWQDWRQAETRGREANSPSPQQHHGRQSAEGAASHSPPRGQYGGKQGRSRWYRKTFPSPQPWEPKRTLCKFHLAGRCKRGNKCAFLHPGRQDWPLGAPHPAAKKGTRLGSVWSGDLRSQSRSRRAARLEQGSTTTDKP